MVRCTQTPKHLSLVRISFLAATRAVRKKATTWHNGAQPPRRNFISSQVQVFFSYETDKRFSQLHPVGLENFSVQLVRNASAEKCNVMVTMTALMVPMSWNVIKSSLNVSCLFWLYIV